MYCFPACGGNHVTNRRCPVSPTVRRTPANAWSIASRSKTQSPDARKHVTGSSANSCAASPRNCARVDPPPRDLRLSQAFALHQLLFFGKLPKPASAAVSDLVLAVIPPREKSAVGIRSLRPVAILRKTLPPPRSVLTPERSRLRRHRRAQGSQRLPALRGQRATSEQCKLWMVIPRPAFGSAAVATRYSLSSCGKTIWRTLERDVTSAPSLHPFGQVLPEAMHNLENLFGGFLVVRHLHATAFRVA